jgi:hypothetical protein
MAAVYIVTHGFGHSHEPHLPECADVVFPPPPVTIRFTGSYSTQVPFTAGSFCNQESGTYRG